MHSGHSHSHLTKNQQKIVTNLDKKITKFGEHAHILPKKRILFPEAQNILDENSKILKHFNKSLLALNKIEKERDDLVEDKKEKGITETAMSGIGSELSHVNTKIEKLGRVVQIRAEIVAAKINVQKAVALIQKAEKISAQLLNVGLMAMGGGIVGNLLLYLKDVPHVASSAGSVALHAAYAAVFAIGTWLFVKFSHLEEKLSNKHNLLTEAGKIMKDGKINSNAAEDDEENRE